MKQKSAAAPPHSLPAGESRNHLAIIENSDAM